MKKPLAFLFPLLSVSPVLAAEPAGLPEGALPLTTEPLQQPAAKVRSEQCVASGTVNGTFSVTLVLDPAALKEALSGGRLQILDAHLMAGRKSATNIGYAMEDGVIHFTHMRFHRAQSDTIPATSTPSLQEFVKENANLESIQGAVITFVHASGQNQGPVAYGSYYYLDLHTPQGVKTFTGYAENLKVSDRRLGSVSIPQGSPAVRGTLYVEKALSAQQAAASNSTAKPTAE